MRAAILLFLAALCAANSNVLQAAEISDETLNKLKHLKTEFDLLRKELAALVVANEPVQDVQPVPVQDVQPVPVQDVVQPEPVEEAETDIATDEISDIESDKRCPNGCGSKKKKVKTCVKRCPTCECEGEHPGAASTGSDLFKRFVHALKPSDQTLVQHYAGSKRAFIERLVRGSHYGPNAEDFAKTAKRQLPTEDRVVQDFIETLNPAEKALVQGHKSSIPHLRQAILEGSKADTSERKRQVDPAADPAVDAVLSKLDPADQDVMKNHISKIEYLEKAEAQPTGNPDEEAVPAKRQVDPDKVEELLNHLDEEGKEVMQAHLSQIDKLEEAAKRPTGNPDEASGEPIVDRLVSDIRSARKRGFSMKVLLEALKKRASSVRA